jgi:hypothetical protein
MSEDLKIIPQYTSEIPANIAYLFHRFVDAHLPAYGQIDELSQSDQSRTPVNIGR